MCAVKVYLDNSDLSNLFKRKTTQHQEILDALLQFKSDGIATYWLSYWHIYEFLQPAAPSFVGEHREKARFLKSLCEQNALPYIGDVIADRQVPAGVWIPVGVAKSVQSEIANDLRKRLRDQIHTKAKEQLGLPRRQRRALLAKQRLQRAIGELAPVEPALAETTILSPQFAGEQPFTRFLKGEIGKSELSDSLAILICDPEVYNYWMLEQTGTNTLKVSFYEVSWPFFDMLRKIISSWPNIVSSQKAMKQLRREYFRFARNSDLPPKTILDVIGPAPERPRDPIEIFSFMESEMVHIRLRYISDYMKYIVTRGRYKENDLIDLMHLFHVPDVDLMRCDQGMYRAMHNSRHIPKQKLVDRLDKLPDTIRMISSGQSVGAGGSLG